MRRDMKDVIIDVYRRGGYYDGIGHMRCRDLEDMPVHEGMKDHHGYGKEPNDRLNPLRRFLEKNLGRPWNKVYAEICEDADVRSIRGWHMREHVKQMVISETELAAILGHRWRDHYWEFYEDSKGILRMHNYDRKKWKMPKRHDADECEINNKPYVRINNCWFEATYHHYTECREEIDYLTQKKVKRYYPKRETRSVRQLNKKKLKRLGLSNQPGWKWYERHAA